VLFFKQESLVLARHDVTLELLDRDAIVLTPHLLDPLEGTDAKQRELGVIAAGTFNLGVPRRRRADAPHRRGRPARDPPAFFPSASSRGASAAAPVDELDVAAAEDHVVLRDVLPREPKDHRGCVV
jgi:hypothetical protein